MDPVNGTASVLALVQVAAVLGKSILVLCQSIRDAPTELNAIANHFKIIQLELHVLENIPGPTIGKSNTDETYQILATALESAVSNIRAIERACLHLEVGRSLERRLRWALLDRPSIQRAMHRLQDTESSLCVVLQILTLCRESAISAAIEAVNIHSSQAQDRPLRHTVGQEASLAVATFGSKTAQIPRRESISVNVFHMALAFLGLHGSLVQARTSDLTRWRFVVQFFMPFSSFLGHYALLIQLALMIFPMCRVVQLNLGSGVAFAKVISEDSLFIEACKRGDVYTARDMICREEAHASDVTERNWSPITYAIAGGNIEIVRLLLQTGAGVNWTFCYNHTSPLQYTLHQRQLDIVRLLLNCKADSDYVNAYGWDSMFFCWPSLNREEQPMVEYLRLLAEDSVHNCGLIDADGWTCFHRTASFATPENLQFLLQLGADPMAKSLPMEWTAMQHAIFYGNENDFKALLPIFKHSITTMIDMNGWRLLHLAAAGESRFIIADLLRRGANPCARTSPSSSKHIDDALFCKACSPRDIAANECEEHLAVYDQCLQELGYRHDGDFVDHRDESEESDIFWEAEEQQFLELAPDLAG